MIDRGGPVVIPLYVGSFVAEVSAFLARERPGPALVSPSGDFGREGDRFGRYRIAVHGNAENRIPYPDFAFPLLDEVDTARYHREHVARHMALTSSNVEVPSS
ncbi:MAG TPA: hypothetical protein VJT49_00595 [Amycolatopsis sp.]|uniref:hypothetical protein n=1 Tax=Amycolatopsis sp. TaxID=37632 RepID=UPI002B45CF16|nr:hypothetical protein [Amycolatopsis sp.]HKS43613.1 hypothetical protein [Amycolatopsis sp.]